MDIKKIIQQLHPLERIVFPLLKEYTKLEKLISNSKLQEVEVIRALQWLQNKGLVKIKEELNEVAILSKRGEGYSSRKLPERMFLAALEKAPLQLAELKIKALLTDDEANISIGLLKRKNLIEINKEKRFNLTAEGQKALLKKFPEEELFEKLKKGAISVSGLNDLERYAFAELIKRSIVQKELIKYIEVELTDTGRRAIREKIDIDVVDRVTAAMLREGSWKEKTFRRYDSLSSVPKISGGKRHFVNQIIEYVKQIWLELGFMEMHGNNVHTSFWDLDALFVPQDHPAREMQDTFYIKNPCEGKLPPFWKKIKEVHENGGTTGSNGWQTPWSEEKAKELLLRTHTTVLSAQTLSKLKKEELPLKFFSIGKVWRNEVLDWKHLFEFYQVEGIVVDENANFRHLLAYLKEFFGKMGYKDARIRPAHFPYTYLSGEVDVLHPEKNQWIELGGCGIFRPEVTAPLLDFECPVLAWGLGLERIICPYYSITDLREIYKNDVKVLRESKIWLK